jgi:hypothetical protein
MLRQLGYRKNMRLHSRIVDVDLKNNARGRRSRFVRSRSGIAVHCPTRSCGRPPSHWFDRATGIPTLPVHSGGSLLSGFRSACCSFFAPACASCKPGGNCVSPGVSTVWTMLVLTEASMVTAFQRQQSSARLFCLRLHLCPHLGHRQAMAPATAALAGRPLCELKFISLG